MHKGVVYISKIKVDPIIEHIPMGWYIKSKFALGLFDKKQSPSTAF